MKGNSGKTFLKVLVLALFGSAFIWRCANVGAPIGGDRDTIPPRAIAAAPDFNATNFTGKRIYLTFDEYVQLKDQQKEFFTSPPMKKNPILSIRGRGVQVDIRDTLLENTTYSIVFGSSIVDNHEGNPLNGFRYVFSTGPEIDSMYMSGYVVDAFKKDSIAKAVLFFFDPAADSIPHQDSTLLKSTPLAVARAEDNGLFLAQNLKPIDYRVYAIQDNNNNFKYDPGTDQVAFLDGVFNPADMTGFDVRYDTVRMYLVPEPQLYFRAFTDTQFKRQSLAASERPEQHRINLIFNAPYPRIDTLTLEGIDSLNVITEYVSPTRDTINLWLNMPSAELPDTIKGRISYMKHDSINNLVMSSDMLNLNWRYIESREEKREREREEKKQQEAEEAGEEYTPPVKPNPFKYNSSVTSELNPEQDISLTFDIPLVGIDTSRIELMIRDEELDLPYDVDFRFSQDTVNIKKYVISSTWEEGRKYELVVPEKVFTNVAGQQNDSIKVNFTVMSADKYGTLNVRVKGKTDSSLYVLTLRDTRGGVIQSKKYVTSGTYTFRYLNAGEVKLHVLEDMNGNGIWDTGNLIERRQPERIEIFSSPTGDELITIKVGWDIDIDADMNELFRPFDIMDVRQRVHRSEEQRLETLRQEAIKRWEREAQQRGRR